MTTHAPFWIGFGDIHTHTSALSRIPDLALAKAVIVSGDLTNHGRAAEAAKVMEAIRAVNPRIFAQVGNMDHPEVTAYLETKGWNIHVKVRALDPDDSALGILGVGASTPTPFGTPYEVSEEQIKTWLDTVKAQVKPFSALLAVIHTPPFDTVADQIGAGRHVGSPAVRAFLEAVQPDVCLTGHIHESSGAQTLGRTTLINPGPLGQGGYAYIRREGSGLKAELRRV